MLRSRSRAGIVPGVVLASAAALTLTGCGLMTPITTQGPYAASDGVRVEVTDDVWAENLLLLTADAEQPALLIGLVANHSKTDGAEYSLSTADGTELHSGSLEAEAVVNLNDEPVEVTGVDTVPGSTAVINVAAGGEVSSVPVPVLDGTLEQYREFLEAAGQDVPEPEERPEPRVWGH